MTAREAEVAFIGLPNVAFFFRGGCCARLPGADQSVVSISTLYHNISLLKDHPLIREASPRRLEIERLVARALRQPGIQTVND